MPHPCVVCGRSRMNPNNREEEYMFFGFPVNHDVRCQKWLEFCCREDLYKLTRKQLLQRMICSKHFEQKYFVNNYFDRLNCSAVPTIYDPKQSLYNITCILCGRSRKDPPENGDDGTTFHHFPGEEFRCLKWLEFVGIESYYRLTRKEILYCYLCSNHFDKSQFVSGYQNRLISTAVPNIRYPDQMDGTEQFIMEILPEVDQPGDKPVKLDPLPPEVLDSQACVACGRPRSDSKNRVEKYKFHPFPAYEIGRCLRWCQFLGREDILKMSPNQIRRLVLCSKHFSPAELLKKTGSYDAVPTIRDVSDEAEAEVDNVDFGEGECAKVSSKKLLVENRPKPLAKKRGKTKRSTLINIPKLVDNRVLRKLPLPPASSNWNLQIPGHIQPIIANNLTPTVNKVILPFTGNISDLGKPIPVSSLSSIPPGLLIKIDLPGAKPVQPSNQKVTSETEKKQEVQLDVSESEEQEETIEYLDEIYMKPEELEEDTEVQEFFESSDVVDVKRVDTPKRKRIRKKMSARTRRSMMPIRSELQSFLDKLKPLMGRLPLKARARVKSAILTLVNDNF